MKYRTIPEDVWAQVREDWTSCRDPVDIIAARHGIATRTLSKKARTARWPPRGSQDAVSVARRLYADITEELRASLRALQTDGTGEQTATAAERGPLIRAHRRALIALLEVRKPVLARAESAKAKAKPDSGEAAESFPALDLDVARRDILDRLTRLDRSPSADLRPPPLVPKEDAAS